MQVECVAEIRVTHISKPHFSTPACLVTSFRKAQKGFAPGTLLLFLDVIFIVSQPSRTCLYVAAGRALGAREPDESIRNPDYLPAHSELLVAYSESGHEAEARAEAAEILRLSPNFSLEGMRQRLPFKDQAELERFLDGLRKAGLK